MSDDPMIGTESIGVFIEFGDTDRMKAFLDRFGTDHPMYPLGVGFAHFTNNEFEQAIDAFEDLDTMSELQVQLSYPMIAMAALSLRDYEKAKEYLIRANPQLASDTNTSVDRKNLNAAIMLAYAMRQTNDDRPASRLLTQAWDVVQQMPRIGVGGHGIADVHILAIQGRKEAALDALREAIDEGFVSLMSYEFWTLDQAVFVDSLRDNPRFEAMRFELHEIIDGMRQNVRQAEESGDWNPLLDRARQELTAAVRL